MKSPIYWHPLLYKLALKALYNGHYQERYSAVAEHIPPQSRVFDACAGDAFLWKGFLSRQNVIYHGCDIQAVFVRHAQKLGIAFSRLDIRSDPLPESDIAILQASLYQFIPQAHIVLNRLLASCRRLVITEPVHNIASSNYKPVAWLAGLATAPGNGPARGRFTVKTLRSLMEFYYRPAIELEKAIAGGREMLYIIRSQAAEPTETRPCSKLWQWPVIGVN